nr:MAG TPA_asm: hypothetical protein [Caudoviricetes sp.]
MRPHSSDRVKQKNVTVQQGSITSRGMMRLQDADSKSCVSVSLSLAFLHAIVKLNKKCGGTKRGALICRNKKATLKGGSNLLI